MLFEMENPIAVSLERQMRRGGVGLKFLEHDVADFSVAKNAGSAGQNLAFVTFHIDFCDSDFRL